MLHSVYSIKIIRISCFDMQADIKLGTQGQTLLKSEGPQNVPLLVVSLVVSNII